MARMPHDKADARDAAHSAINLEMRRYARRLKQTAEDHIAIAHDEAVAAGLPFDPAAVASAAVLEARRTYIAAELPVEVPVAAAELES